MLRANEVHAKRYHVQDLQLLVNRFESGVHSTSEASVSVVKFSQVAKIPLSSKIKKQINVEQSKDDLLRPGYNHFCPAECLCGWMTGVLCMTFQDRGPAL